ncbi:MAG: type II CAAX prenyl endopeptidase Rce1 family protein [Planctomycetota bacterium]
MEQFAGKLLWFLFLAVVSGSLLVWSWVAWRLTEGTAVESLVPVERRRPVPWDGLAVAAIVFAWLALGVYLGKFAAEFAPVDPLVPKAARAAPAAYERTVHGHGPNFCMAAVGLSASTVAEEVEDAKEGAAEQTTAHPLFQLLMQGEWYHVVLGIFLAVLLAPVFEEFVFRLVLQGWLEKKEGQWRRQERSLRALPRGVLAVAAVSLLFAGIHFRVADQMLPLETVTRMIVLDSIPKVLTLVLAIILLRLGYGATAADLGWSWRHLGSDCRLGFFTFLAIAPALFALQAVLALVFGEHFAADPIPLFFLALVLGGLYFRTHRIVPSIVLHASLNGTSTLLVWLISIAGAGK